MQSVCTRGTCLAWFCRSLVMSLTTSTAFYQPTLWCLMITSGFWSTGQTCRAISSFLWHHYIKWKHILTCLCIPSVFLVAPALIRKTWRLEYSRPPHVTWWISLDWCLLFTSALSTLYVFSEVKLAERQSILPNEADCWCLTTGVYVITIVITMCTLFCLLWWSILSQKMSYFNSMIALYL